MAAPCVAMMGVLVVVLYLIEDASAPLKSGGMRRTGAPFVLFVMVPAAVGAIFRDRRG